MDSSLLFLHSPIVRFGSPVAQSAVHPFPKKHFIVLAFIKAANGSSSLAESVKASYVKAFIVSTFLPLLPPIVAIRGKRNNDTNNITAKTQNLPTFIIDPFKKNCLELLSRMQFYGV
jgi:hypothetical protein